METKDFIECPYCDKQIQVLRSHLRKTHKITDWEGFKKEYPCIKTMSDSYLKRRREIMIASNNDPVFREKSINASKTSELKKKLARNNLAKINANRKPEWEEKRIASVIKANKSKTKRETMRKHGKVRYESNPEYWAEKLCGGGISHHPEITLPNGKTRKLRSQCEYYILEYLNEQNIYYEYETIRIPYEYKGEKRSYIPDVIIGNTIIEIKPSNLRNDEKTLAKKQAVLQHNYKFYFVGTVLELQEVLASATTIESIV